MPRVLARLPYGAKTKPVEAFDFEEDTDGSDHHKYAWMNAAYAMAVNINRSFKLYGWCSRIRGVESGGAVTNLPVHTFPTDDGGVAMKCPTEIAIDDRREAELAKLGLMPLLHKKNTDIAAFIGAQSLQKPRNTTIRTPPPTPTVGAAALPVRGLPLRPLPQGHRPRQGRLLQGEGGHAEMAATVDHQLRRRQSGAFDRAVKAQKPLREAEVVVEEVEGNPGVLQRTLLPPSALSVGGADGSLRLVSKLPSQKQE